MADATLGFGGLDLATYDFDTITAEQAWAFNVRFGDGDSLTIARTGANLVPTFDDTTWTVTLSDTVTGRSVLFGSGFHKEGGAGHFLTTVGSGAAQTEIGSPRGETFLTYGRAFGGGGNDTIMGADDAWGGTGRDVFESTSGRWIERIWDWESGDMLRLSYKTPTAGKYVEATMNGADDMAVGLFARDQIRAGMDYVVVQVGGDLWAFGDNGANEGMSTNSVKIIGRGLGDIAHSDFLPLNSAAPFAPTPTLTRPTPPPALPTPPAPPGPDPFAGWQNPQIPGGTNPPATNPPTQTATYNATGTIIGNMDTAHIGSLLGASIDDATATRLVLGNSSTGSGLQLEGTGFTYDGNEQLTGGVTSKVVYQSFSLGVTLTVKANAAPFGGWVAQDATQQAFATILQGNDTIYGSQGPDVIRTFGGHDVIWGFGGRDSLYGGDGDDLIYGLAPGPGDASGYGVLRGEAGNDTLVGTTYFDDMHGNMGSDSLTGGDGGDWVVGGQDNDVLYGDGGADIVYGNLGADRAYGGEGDDFVRGGQDDDVLEGGGGDDWMSGDRGADTLTGGSGADQFHIFAGAGLEQVTDFSYAAGDRVNLLPGQAYSVSQLGADSVIDLGNGDRMVLSGVSQASLGAGWVVLG